MNEPTSKVRSFNGVHHELCHSNEAITYERLMSTSSLVPYVLLRGEYIIFTYTDIIT